MHVSLNSLKQGVGKGKHCLYGELLRKDSAHL